MKEIFVQRIKTLINFLKGFLKASRSYLLLRPCKLWQQWFNISNPVNTNSVVVFLICYFHSYVFGNGNIKRAVFLQLLVAWLMQLANLFTGRKV